LAGIIKTGMCHRHSSIWSFFGRQAGDQLPIKLYVNVLPACHAYRFWNYYSAILMPCIHTFLCTVLMYPCCWQLRSVRRTSYWQKTDWRMQMTSWSSLRLRPALVTPARDLTTERTERTSNVQRPTNV